MLASEVRGSPELYKLLNGKDLTDFRILNDFYVLSGFS